MTINPNKNKHKEISPSGLFVDEFGVLRLISDPDLVAHGLCEYQNKIYLMLYK